MRFCYRKFGIFSSAVGRLPNSVLFSIESMSNSILLQSKLSSVLSCKFCAVRVRTSGLYSTCEHLLSRLDLLYKSTRGLVTTERSNPCQLNAKFNMKSVTHNIQDIDTCIYLLKSCVVIPNSSERNS
jgi:hypothetical protein